MPQFLTATLVNLTQVLLLQKDYFRGHAIWKPLEVELHRRRNNLNNEQLAQVVHAFGMTGNATRFLFSELEETIIDTPIAIESEHLLKILSGYSIGDLGEPVIYAHIEQVLLHRGIFRLSVPQILQACKDFKRATNKPPGAAFFHAAEKHLKS